MKNKNLTKQAETETADTSKHDALVKDVREAIGAEMMGKLAAQPTGIANGGADSILQRSCTEAAGFSDPVAAAVAKFRTYCGSSAVPRIKIAITTEAQ